MKKLTLLLKVSGIFLVATILCNLNFVLADSDQGVQQGQAELRIAVVDTRKVLRSSGGWEDFQREHQAKRQEAEEALQEFENRLAVIELEFENLPSGSEQAAEKMEEFEAVLQNYREAEQELTEEIQSHWVEGFRGFFKIMEEVISSYAEENDIDIVLKKQQVDLDSPDAQELETYEASDVLYAATDLDISADITRLFNEKYDENENDEQ